MAPTESSPWPDRRPRQHPRLPVNLSPEGREARGDLIARAKDALHAFEELDKEITLQDHVEALRRLANSLLEPKDIRSRNEVVVQRRREQMPEDSAAKCFDELDGFMYMVLRAREDIRNVSGTTMERYKAGRSPDKHDQEQHERLRHLLFPFISAPEDEPIERFRPMREAENEGRRLAQVLLKKELAADIPSPDRLSDELLKAVLARYTQCACE